jgi:hypothetical protein
VRCGTGPQKQVRWEKHGAVRRFRKPLLVEKLSKDVSGESDFFDAASGLFPLICAKGSAIPARQTGNFGRMRRQGNIGADGKSKRDVAGYVST